MATRTALAIILTAATMLTQASCSQIECGEGTTEQNGECVPSDGERPQNDDCGIGTHYDDAEGGCVPDFPPTICGENTEPFTNSDGVIECRGTGGNGCGPINCPDPTAGKVTLCGRLFDVQTDLAITGGTDGALCAGAGGTATGGPCDVEVEFFPALPFATNPTGTPPLPPGDFKMNNCGWFAARDIAEPELGYMGIGVDDRGTTLDEYTLAGVALPASAGLREDSLVVYAVRRDTDDAWTNTAGDPFGGQTFGTRGAYVPIFLHGEGAPDGLAEPAAVPVAGVTVTENSANEPANTYYFLDTDPHTRSTLDNSAGTGGQPSTGANGSAVKVNSSLVNHSGTGSEPDGCKWPSDLAAAIMGVTFVQRRVAELLASEVTCP